MISFNVRAQDRSTGALLIPPKLFDELSKAPPIPGAAVGESKISMRNRFPEPKDQGGPASCTAFAVGYELGTYLARTNNGWTDENSEHLLSPAFIYNQIALGDNTRGVYIQTALTLAHGGGCCTWKTMPYKESDTWSQPEYEFWVEARHFAYPEWDPIKVSDFATVRSYLASFKPVIIAANVDISDNGLWPVDEKNVTHGYLHPDHLGKHTMVVVGYDDFRNAFEIMNSWGPNWNDAGFAWIGYDFWPQWVKEGYVLRQQTLPHPPGAAATASRNTAKSLQWLPIGPAGLKNGNWGFPAEVDLAKIKRTAEKKLPNEIREWLNEPTER